MFFKNTILFFFYICGENQKKYLSKVINQKTLFAKENQVIHYFLLFLNIYIVTQKRRRYFLIYNSITTINICISLESDVKIQSVLIILIIYIHVKCDNVKLKEFLYQKKKFFINFIEIILCIYCQFVIG